MGMTNWMGLTLLAAASLAVLLLWPSWLIRGVLQPLLPHVLFCAGCRRR
jgi:hypothetical protein